MIGIPEFKNVCRDGNQVTKAPTDAANTPNVTMRGTKAYNAATPIIANGARGANLISIFVSEFINPTNRSTLPCAPVTSGSKCNAKVNATKGTTIAVRATMPANAG